MRKVNRHVEGKIMSLGSDIIPFLEEQWEISFDPNISAENLKNMISYSSVFSIEGAFQSLERDKEGQSLFGSYVVDFSFINIQVLSSSDLNKEIEQIYYDIWVELKEDCILTTNQNH